LAVTRLGLLGVFAPSFRPWRECHIIAIFRTTEMLPDTTLFGGQAVP